VTLDRVRLLDPTLYEVLVARGDLTIGGALARSPGVAGRIELGESELRVPETGLGTAAPIPDIRHVNETAAERRTRAAAGLLQRQAAPSGGGTSAVGLDIEIAAPGRIFLRGRGIDAEFGGSLRVGGTTANVIPAGRFDLIRGRISILGTRLDITEGSATLQGDFDPFLRLRAQSRAGGYRIIIAVDGPASSPDISLSSDPFLPEDEILAQLLFGRSVSSLSPVQLIQLADAASSLAGGRSDGGLLSNLREGLGLDNLDLQTDDEGNAAVRAGRYLNENIYTDVTVGAQGDSAVSLNIDLTPDVTARGSFSSEGSSSVGVFFERDY
jgi:translocation and assembly module TamB